MPFSVVTFYICYSKQQYDRPRSSAAMLTGIINCNISSLSVGKGERNPCTFLSHTIVVLNIIVNDANGDQRVFI